MNTSPGSTRTLVIGRSPEVNRSVVGPLLDAGIDAQGCTQPEEASRRYDARQFDLIAIGAGVSGPLRGRLKREFTAQNPDIRFADVFAPVAVKQILQALAQ
jgi:N-hydroxyarylamine O-acetyltransferase